MPSTHRGRPATWSLPTLVRVEITYTTEDRYDEETPVDESSFPQTIHGEVIGVVYGVGGDDAVRLGHVELARIDLYEAGDRLYDVLDSHSGEWESYHSVVRRWDDDETFVPPSFLLILHRLELVEEARGHGLGLHVLARAIRTWARDAQALVVLTAGSSIEREDEDEERERRASESLSRYWQRLGLEPVKMASNAAVLAAYSDSAAFEKTIARHCVWTSPTQAS
jgi:GNAT superfamily N-acetyltransferase